MSFVTVVMPVFNRADLVAETMRSLLAQTHKEFELIVVNDGSTDHSAEVVASFKDSRVRLIDLPGNCGAATARNIGMRMAQGDLIAVMDSDDLALPDRLTMQETFMTANPEVQIAGGNCIKMVNGKNHGMKHPALDGVIKARLLALDGSSMIHPSSIMRTGFIRQHRITYPEYVIGDDHALWLSALRQGARFAGQQEFVLMYRRHSGNITAEGLASTDEAQRKTTPLRIDMLHTFFPNLTARQTLAIARVMEHKRNLSMDEAWDGLASIREALRDEISYYGECRKTLKALLESFQRRLLVALAKIKH